MPVITTLASMSKNGFSNNNANAIPASQYYYYASGSTNYSTSGQQYNVYTFNNNIYQLGSSSGYPYYPTLFKYDSTGNITNILSNNPLYYNPTSMVADSTNNTHVLFDNNGSTPGTFLLQKYDTNNTLVYSKQFVFDTVYTGQKTVGITIDSSNNLYVFNVYGSTNILFFTKISSSTYTVVANGQITLSPALPANAINSIRLLGSYTGYTMLAAYSAGYTYLINISPTGTLNSSQRYTTANSNFTGVMSGANFYAIINNNVLIKTPYNSAVPSYSYTLTYPVGVGTPTSYSGISVNGLGNLVAYAVRTNEFFLVPINSVTPTSFVAVPTSFSMTNYTNGNMISNNTNTYISGKITGSGSIQASTLIKTSPNGSDIFGATLINYTLGSSTYNTTLQSIARSNITVTSTTTTRATYTGTFTSVASSVSNLSPTTVSPTLYSYSTHLV